MSATGFPGMAWLRPLYAVEVRAVVALEVRAAPAMGTTLPAPAGRRRAATCESAMELVVTEWVRRCWPGPPGQDIGEDAATASGGGMGASGRQEWVRGRPERHPHPRER
ncbi:hypothetical protein GCM10022230_04230 [Pseudoclavibacter caeni]